MWFNNCVIFIPVFETKKGCLFGSLEIPFVLIR